MIYREPWGQFGFSPAFRGWVRAAEKQTVPGPPNGATSPLSPAGRGIRRPGERNASRWPQSGEGEDRCAKAPSPPRLRLGTSPRRGEEERSRPFYPRPFALRLSSRSLPADGTRIMSRWNGAGAGAGSVALARHWAMSPQVPARPAVRLPPRSPTPVPEGKPTGRAAARSHILLRQAIFGRPSSPPLPSPQGGSEGRVEASDSTPVGGPKGRMRGHQQPDGKPGVARESAWPRPNPPLTLRPAGPQCGAHVRPTAP